MSQSSTEILAVLIRRERSDGNTLPEPARLVIETFLNHIDPSSLTVSLDAPTIVGRPSGSSSLFVDARPLIISIRDQVSLQLGLTTGEVQSAYCVAAALEPRGRITPSVRLFGGYLHAPNDRFRLSMNSVYRCRSFTAFTGEFNDDNPAHRYLKSVSTAHAQVISEVMGEDPVMPPPIYLPRPF